MPRFRSQVHGETTAQTQRYATKKEVREAVTRDQLRYGGYSAVEESDEPHDDRERPPPP